MIANALFSRQSKAKGFTPHLFRGWGSLSSQPNRKGAGFTLLELLIVITILAILAVIIIFVLNPAETLKKSRDVQRLSDLATLKNALALYATTVSPVDLDAAVGLCLSGATSTARIAYSSVVADPTCTTNPTEGADTGATFASDACFTAGNVTATVTLADGAGWLPVALTNITGGSPISGLPLDPTNTAISATPSNADLVYRYACQSTGASGKPSGVFEVNAILESDTYKAGSTTDDKAAKDGGDNADYYEIGTSVKLIGGGTAF